MTRLGSEQGQIVTLGFRTRVNQEGRSTWKPAASFEFTSRRGRWR